MQGGHTPTPGKKEVKDPYDKKSEAKEQAEKKRQTNAKSLAEAVNALISDTETETKKRIPSSVHPLIAFGYDARDGNLKKWVGEVRKKIEDKGRDEIKNVEEKRDREITAADNKTTEEKRRLQEEKKRVEEARQQEEKKFQTDDSALQAEIANARKEQQLQQQAKAEFKQQRLIAEAKFQECNAAHQVAVNAEVKAGFADDAKEQEKATKEEKSKRESKKEAKTVLDNIIKTQEENKLALEAAEAKIQQAGQASTTLQSQEKVAAERFAKTQARIHAREKEIEDIKTAETDAATDAAKKVVEATKTAIDKINHFEQEVRDTVNGWMMGQPVETDQLKIKAKQLEADLGTAVTPELKEYFANFGRKIDDEVNLLRIRAQAHVNSNWSFRLYGQTLAADVQGIKFSSKELKELEGSCGFLLADKEPTFNPRTKTFDDCWLDKGCQQAYVLVKGDGSAPDKPKAALYYINNITQERTKVCEGDSSEMKAVLAELKKNDDNTVVLYGQGTGFLTPKSADQQHPARILKRDDEELLKKLSGHERRPKDAPSFGDWKGNLIGGKSVDVPKSDWKDILPIAVTGSDAAAESEIKAEKEARRLDEEDKTKGPEYARDAAIARLMERGKGECKYDYQDQRFSVHHSKDENGQMQFFVTHMPNKWYERGQAQFYEKNAAEGMAAMVKLCHEQNPLSAVVLSCEPPPQHGDPLEHAKRVQIQARQAIEAAEKEAKKGIFIGIKLGKNVLDALEKMEDQELKRRAEVLHKQWSEQIEKKKTDQKELKKNELGKLLISEMPDEVKVVAGSSEQERKLTDAFVSKQSGPAGESERNDELKAEVDKIERIIKQHALVTTSVEQQLKEIKADIAKMVDDSRRTGVDIDSTTLAQQAAKLEELKAGQEAANRAFAPVLGEQGLLNRFMLWVASPAMAGLVGEAARDKRLQRLHTIQKEVEDRFKNLPDNLPKIQDLQRQIDVLKKDAEEKEEKKAEAAAAARAAASGAAAIGALSPPPHLTVDQCRKLHILVTDPAFRLQSPPLKLSGDCLCVKK